MAVIELIYNGNNFKNYSFIWPVAIYSFMYLLQILQKTKILKPQGLSFLPLLQVRKRLYKRGLFSNFSNESLEFVKYPGLFYI